MPWDNDSTHLNPTDPRGLPVNIFLTSSGDGLGTKNLNGNYSSAPTDFYFEPSRGRYEVYSLLIAISDAASFSQGDYGAIAGGLTNGVKFFIKNFGQAEVQIMAGVNFKSNYNFLSIAHDTTLSSFAGGAQTLASEIDLIKTFGTPLVLNKGDRFIVRLNDDLTGLISHIFAFGGERFN